MFLAGINVPDRLVLKLAHLLDDHDLEMKLRGALAKDIRVLGLEISERETILAALDDPPEELAELRGVLLRDVAWLRQEGLA